jgi:dipeptidase E
MRLLLLSNSTNPGGQFLQHAKEDIGKFLHGVNKVLFLPYAAVSLSFNDYEKLVQKTFSGLGVEVESLHHFRDCKKTVREAEAIVIGGGNTFRLLKMIQQLDIIETLRFRVLDGAPFIGWSAGANVACPTICTTNDMPIVEPDNFSAINLVRFQINPHFTDVYPKDHSGETREERIEEFIVMDPFSYVVGLREGSGIMVDGGVISLIGPHTARVFKNGFPPKEIGPADDLDFLFE